MITGTAAFTAEQCTVIDAPVDARQVVLAPAGTGKTEVVARRLSALIRAGDVSPSSGVLILSFYNTAVVELRRRTRREGAAAAAAQVATLDSFASRLLAIHDTSGDWQEVGYLERIRRATSLVLADADTREITGPYRHLIVDEVQDLVGDRAEFVDALLRSLAPEAGFTLLGDPAQGISDFQLEGSTASTTSIELLRRVLARAPAPDVREFTTNFRAKSKVAERVASRGAVVRARALGLTSEAGDGGIWSELLGLKMFDMLQATAILRNLATDGATGAILCRYNSQALVLSRVLYEAGVAHRFRGEAADTWVGSWLAEAFRGYRYPTISRATFSEKVARTGMTDEWPEAAWRSLKRAEGRSGPDISLRELVSRLRTRRLPDDLAEAHDLSLGVSSVHRAKGLEWDVVFVCGLEVGGDDEFDELRLAYVAMTRTRDELFRLVGPDTRGMRRRDQKDGRWVRTDLWSRRMTQLEIVPDDVEWTVPAGLHYVEIKPHDIQDYLAGSVRAGDPVLLELDRSIVGERARAVYRIEHAGFPIGITSEGLSSVLLENIARHGGGAFPRRLTGARVQAVETTGGSSAASTRSGLGSAGLWLRPRLRGLVDVEWRQSA